jgi:hypothetical protein
VTQTQAYVLVQLAANQDPIGGLIQTIPGVVHAEDVRGPYDALALARLEADGVTLEGILAQIRDLPGVIRALAAPVTASALDVAGGEAA